MSDLAETAEDLVIYLEFNLAGAAQATDPEGIAASADAACSYFQAVGICELLLDAETDAFFHMLVRSARMRRWLLRRAAQGLPDQPPYPARVLKASNTRGLFAALAAGDRPLAAEIATLSATRWNERVEYEDDFWYAHFLHRCVAGDRVEDLRTILAAYTTALDGDVPPPRHRLCATLLAPPDRQNGDALAAFADLIAARRAQMRDLAETSILSTDELFVPFSSVYVEGLAWLQLLEGGGIVLDEEFAFCPALARDPRYPPVPAGLFPP